MHFTTDIRPGMTAESVRAKIAEPLVSYLMENGCSAEDAMKVAASLHGNKAALCLTTPELYICDVTKEALEQRRLLDVFQGKLLLPLYSATGQAAIALRPATEADPQQIYAVALEKAGMTSKETGPTSFLSFQLVIPQTQGDRILSLALKLTFDGENYSGEINRGLYQERANTVTGTRDRLAELVIPNNVVQIAIAAMYKAGFPLETIQKNRASRQERFEQSQVARQGGTVRGRQPVGAGVPVNSTRLSQAIEEDYFSGE